MTTDTPIALNDTHTPQENDSSPALFLPDLQRELAALPTLMVVDGAGNEMATGGEAAINGPLEIAARQGRLMMRLTASSEALQGQYRALEERYTQLAEQVRGRDERVEQLTEGQRQSEKRARQVALESLHLMDALDWAYDALVHNGQDGLAREMDAARRDCLRRLAAVGISEIPAEGMMDGRLHDGLEAVPTDAVPQYHIVRVIRRGFQMGTDILRRAGVATAL